MLCLGRSSHLFLQLKFCEPLTTVAASKVNSMNSSPLAAIWHWYPLLAWVACARFCSLPLGSLSYLNFYLKLRLDSNFSYGTGLIQAIRGVSLSWGRALCLGRSYR